MKRRNRLLGLPLLCFGVILMTGWYALGLSYSNAANIIATVLIIAGIVSFVWMKKAESKY